jgi:hypothetical protein
MWIDHRKAVIVVVSDAKEAVIEIRSGVEKQLRPSRGPRFRTEYGAQEAPPDDRQENEFMGHLNIYFDRIVSCIRDAESIFVFGPGEAKDELKKRIARNRLRGNLVYVETAGQMTDRQIAAKVRQSFRLPARTPQLKRRGGPLRGNGGS